MWHIRVLCLNEQHPLKCLRFLLTLCADYVVMLSFWTRSFCICLCCNFGCILCFNGMIKKTQKRIRYKSSRRVFGMKKVWFNIKIKNSYSFLCELRMTYSNGSVDRIWVKLLFHKRTAFMLRLFGSFGIGYILFVWISTDCMRCANHECDTMVT